MSTLTINTPQVLKISNTSDLAIGFVAYRENFVSVLSAGFSIEFYAETPGQVLYYLKQATTNGLTVEQLADFDEEEENLILIETPATITITNTSNGTKSFIPYKENFVVDLAAGDEVELQAKTVGQVLYYLAQATTGLTVTQAKAAAE